MARASEPAESHCYLVSAAGNVLLGGEHFEQDGAYDVSAFTCDSELHSSCASSPSCTAGNLS